jgi:hypothetical protein
MPYIYDLPIMAMQVHPLPRNSIKCCQKVTFLSTSLLRMDSSQYIRKYKENNCVKREIWGRTVTSNSAQHQVCPY